VRELPRQEAAFRAFDPFLELLVEVLPPVTIGEGAHLLDQAARHVHQFEVLCRRLSTWFGRPFVEFEKWWLCTQVDPNFE
jgi:hypothetical protein